MSTTKGIIAECSAALKAAGCVVSQNAQGTSVILPGQHLVQMVTWHFNLLCQRVYYQVND